MHTLHVGIKKTDKKNNPTTTKQQQPKEPQTPQKQTTQKGKRLGGVG